MAVIENEKCLGCGAPAPKHPYVAVTRKDNSEPWRAFPTCFTCWKDPAHRTKPIKAHFFARGQETVAIAAATAQSSLPLGATTGIGGSGV